ncbi:MAG: PrpF domain-containing protein [Galactobacter sp.]
MQRPQRTRIDGDQVAIPCLLMRGGSSRGPFFDASNLPTDIGTRDAVLLHVMGSPHPRQVDGVGGRHPLTSKVGIVGPSTETGVDLDFTFAQLQPEETSVNTKANCGNMLAAALPFALETGLIEAAGDETHALVRTTNTGLTTDITVQTPDDPDGERFVAYAGDTSIDGVHGTGSAIRQDFLDTAGSVADSLLPTGNVTDTIDLPGGTTLTVTCIDNGQPMVIVAAADLGLTGQESPIELEANDELVSTIESLRLIAAEHMGLGDVTHANYPKMTIASPGVDGADITTRSFIPHRVHESIGVLAAVTVATALCLHGSVAARAAGAAASSATTMPDDASRQSASLTIAVGHPSGSLDVAISLDEHGDVVRSGILRTARKIMAGEVFVPLSVWDPRGPDSTPTGDLA